MYALQFTLTHKKPELVSLDRSPPTHNELEQQLRQKEGENFSLLAAVFGIFSFAQVIRFSLETFFFPFSSSFVCLECFLKESLQSSPRRKAMPCQCENKISNFLVNELAIVLSRGN
jgi:hypothetical protein